MVEILTPDLCVIGGGSGGLTVVAAARAMGATAVLIEKGKMGGDCLNTGCVPSKALIAAAHHAEAGREAAQFGVTFDEPKVNFGKVHDHVHGVIAGIAPHDSVERFEALGATVIKEHGQFVDKNTVKAGDQLIRARRFVVATGSRAAVPPIPGLDTVPFLTNESIFDLTRKPAHLIVIGGGPIGMELAQAHRRLGCQVTIIEMFDPLGKDDPELTEIALRRIRADGVDVRARTGVVSVAAKGTNISVTVKKDDNEEIITGSHLLIAAGRAPNIENLGLEEAGIKFERSGIAVNAGLRTSNRRVFAIGDVAGGLQFTHVAGNHAGLVVRSALFGLPVKQNNDIVPWATYTDPEIASVGLSEAAARARYGDDFKILRWSFAENDRARAERRTDGLVKLIVSKKGQILGCGIVGARAGEMISLFSYAIANKMKVGSLTKFIAPYPTMTEMARRVAIEFYGEKLSSPWIGRWLAMIRLLP
jgi:pyruvate/2-oxoglutarate dehydrogenase complex dihydrolipoamide dehydrogenase (E3) component